MRRKNKNILAVLMIFILIGCMLLTIRIAKNDSSSNVQQPSFSENQFMMGEGQTPPDKPDGENSEEKISFEKTDNENKEELNQTGGNIELKPIYYAFFGIESLLLSAIILYLMISKMNAKTCKQTFTSLKKIVSYIISTIIITLGFIYRDSSITNTSAKINLTNNTIVNNDINGNFLRVQADSWENNGSNGGNVTLTINNQEAIGNIVIDSVSALDIALTSSHYERTINGDNTAKKITLTLDSSSAITLTGDSYVTSLEDEDSSYSNINFNGYKLHVNGKVMND